MVEWLNKLRDELDISDVVVIVGHSDFNRLTLNKLFGHNDPVSSDDRDKLAQERPDRDIVSFIGGDNTNVSSIFLGNGDAWPRVTRLEFMNRVDHLNDAGRLQRSAPDVLTNFPRFAGPPRL